MNRMPMMVMLSALLPLMYGCASVSVAATMPPDVADIAIEEHGYALSIPPGHLPPPGECRIWYPGEPPGRQSPPGACSELARRVPPGAWLVHGPSDQYEDFVVEVYDEQRPGAVISIRYYDSEDGRFIREESVRRGN